LRGVAFNPENGHLYVMEPDRNALHEFTTNGEFVKSYDLKESGLVNPQAMTFARSGDQTDDPNTFNLYIADSGGTKQGEPAVDPNQLPYQLYLPLMAQPLDSSNTSTEAPLDDSGSRGKVVEVALYRPLTEVQAAAGTTVLSLVRTVETSTWNPSSPDPDGITYNPTSNQLIISDSEVDEISALFKTKQNVYHASLSGTLLGTMSTFAFSREPCGTSYNPTNGHLFYSDDDKRAVFEVNPGNDGILGTGDDILTSFSVTPFASRDPEDVSYDVNNPGLWIIDGLNAEVYHVLPGANGLFDGIAPAGDDVVSQFDTYHLNIHDPEGIYLNPATGNLILTSKDPTKLYEVTIAGVLLRIFNVAAAGGVKLAGVTMAPGSTDPSVNNYYVVDRVVDNDNHPSENDGRLYEFKDELIIESTATPTSSPTSTPTPTPTSTPTSTPDPNSLLNFGPSDDTYVRSDFPNSNYATATTIRIVGSPSPINSYVKFTVSGLEVAPQNAKLRLYVTDPSPVGGAIYLVSNNYQGSSTPWVEGGLKYSNAPAAGGAPITSIGSVAMNTWVEFDVTSAIAGNGQYSFALTSTSSNSAVYGSKEDSVHPPVLVVQP